MKKQKKLFFNEHENKFIKLSQNLIDRLTSFKEVRDLDNYIRTGQLNELRNLISIYKNEVKKVFNEFLPSLSLEHKSLISDLYTLLKELDNELDNFHELNHSLINKINQVTYFINEILKNLLKEDVGDH